ncbi:MAG: tRNA preQ1(34) S-adenosylmethionine ribosyltransferase-isomerase QueA [Rhodospirillales bacterium]|nr:tRNA preQ1(34) S-adenosylmethionine ribosyltransferase-isomerase QueA [Rhodospirillales bacterium]MSP80372.1 tRNA preQ1(34) S-adenosylmethionine ribosyltransferase-isomerase QueA [Rhodospirillales bacterium]
MKVADFDFELPPGLIAQAPAVPRDSARMLVVESGHRADASIRDFPRHLEAGDVLVVNDTRVIPARLAGRIGGAGVEATLTKREGPATWRALAKPGRKFKPGARVVFASPRSGEIAAEVKAKGEGGEVTLGFDLGGERLDAALERAGIMPLPPYIKRPKEGDPADRRDYQTLFAARPGAVAAPTAGLHFTPALVAALEARGVAIAAVTLHVGAGTFLPVKTENVEDHRMHPEWGEVSESVAATVNAARRAGNRVVAVGSTVLRLLESAADAAGKITPFAGETGIFIVPGYRFRVADLMLTNFHLPRSTLFMLVCAFGGTQAMKRAYAHAIAKNYRFYSYGDCCLLKRGSAA